MAEDHHPQHPSGYEKRDANVMVISIIALAVVLFIVVSVIWLDDFFVHTTEEIKYEQALKPIAEDKRELDARTDSMLTTYGVSDTARGTYRIPLERAMELVAEPEPGTN